MTGSNTTDYYRRRAAQATALAEAATMPSVRAIHHDMAMRYGELADTGDAIRLQPALKLAC